MPHPLRAALLALGFAIPLGCALAAPAIAQGTEVALGALKQDSSLPVEIAADQLAIDQASGEATFTGNVVIGQGGLKLSAAEVKVEYVGGTDAKGKIARLIASGGVVLVTGSEAAEAQEAIYSVETGQIVMTGNVVLTQGNNALSGQKMTVNLNDGTALVEGRVTTTLQTGTAP